MACGVIQQSENSFQKDLKVNMFLLDDLLQATCFGDNMSWKIAACASNIKDPKNRSKKICVCGGHNWNNPKKNKHHHSTAKRLEIRNSMIGRERERQFRTS